MSEKLRERIRKLLALAHHAATPEDESLAAAAMARKLMIEYEISPDEVGDDRSGEFILEVVQVQRFSIWQAMVRQAAARMYFCEFMLQVDNPEVAVDFLLFGAQRHMEAAKSFGVYLEQAILRKGAAFPNRTDAFMKSFRNQCAHTLVQRIEALIRKEKPPMVAGTNLPVPVDMQDKLAAALKELTGENPEMVHGKAEVPDALGLALGRQAGLAIALNRQLGGAAKKTGLLGGE